MIPFLIFLFGMLLGSFFNVCTYRIPRGESISFPPSHCPSCEHRLVASDLVPLFSYIFLRGKCKYCQAKISITYPLIEFITPVLYLLLYYTYGISWDLLVYALVISILIIITFIDIEHFIIPNALVLAGLIIGILSLIIGVSPIEWVDALLGLILGGGAILITAILAKLILKKDGMGGGDIKLMAMIGLFMGWRQTGIILLLSVYISFIFIIVMLIFKTKKTGEYLPFGPFIALATVISILYGDQILNLISAYIFG
ncbi:MAG: prepilin peptidase [Clostridiales bacterium]|nr:prepilin peptidase [Clostridiales bacterium]